MQLLNCMLSRLLEADVITFNTMISSEAKAKEPQWHLSLSFLGEMLAREVELHEISYNSAMSACAKSTQWQNAALLLTVMVLK